MYTLRSGRDVMREMVENMWALVSQTMWWLTRLEEGEARILSYPNEEGTSVRAQIWRLPNALSRVLVVGGVDFMESPIQTSKKLGKTMMRTFTYDKT